MRSAVTINCSTIFVAKASLSMSVDVDTSVAFEILPSYLGSATKNELTSNQDYNIHSYEIATQSKPLDSPGVVSRA